MLRHGTNNKSSLPLAQLEEFGKDGRKYKKKYIKELF